MDDAGTPADLRAAAQQAVARALELREQTSALLIAARSVIDGTTAALDLTGRPASRLRKEVAQLQAAMASRATIEQAKGIIMGATGCTPDEAFELLKRQSQHENRKLREVAEELVEAKVRRPGSP